jgi:hypothetical protein
MFLLDDGAAGVCSEQGGRGRKKDLTQRALRTLSALRRGEEEAIVLVDLLIVGD